MMILFVHPNSLVTFISMIVVFCKPALVSSVVMLARNRTRRDAQKDAQ